MTGYLNTKTYKNNLMKKLLLFALLFININSFAQSIETEQRREIIGNINKEIVDYTFNINIEKIKVLGLKNIDALKLLGENKPTNISGVIQNVKGEFFNFEYDDIFIIQTKSDADLSTLNSNPNQNFELYYSIRAIEILKQRYNHLYQNLIQSIIYPSFEKVNLSNYNTWINIYPKIIISFNEVSNDIAISGTYLDNSATPFQINGQNFSLYENFPVISINPELIKGSNKEKGSYPIYKLENPESNYLQYLKEGLLHSICHELIHRYIDIKNNEKGTIYNYIAFGNGRANRESPNYDVNLYNLEEAIVNQTLEDFFKKYGGISNQLLNYYSNVQTDNLNAIDNLSEYRATLMQQSNLNDNLSLDW